LCCETFLGPEKPADFKIISRFRIELGRKLNIKLVQANLGKAWKLYIETPSKVIEDATY